METIQNNCFYNKNKKNIKQVTCNMFNVNNVFEYYKLIIIHENIKNKLYFEDFIELKNNCTFVYKTLIFVFTVGF